MQDEAFFYSFILTSPRHGIVLSLINGVLQLLSKDLKAAVQQGDALKQNELRIKSKFLYLETRDRVQIREEHAIADTLAWIHGEESLKAMLSHQSQRIEQSLASLRAEREFVQTPIDQKRWDAGMFGTRPIWDASNWRANTSVPSAMRTRRVSIFELSLALNTAQVQMNHREADSIRSQLDAAKAELSMLTDLGFRTSTFHVARGIYGKEACLEVLTYMDATTNMVELRRLRDLCRDSQYKGGTRVTPAPKIKPPCTSTQRHVIA